MNNGERIGREQDSDGNRLSSKMTSMESCDRQDIDGNGFRTPFRYLRGNILTLKMNDLHLFCLKLGLMMLTFIIFVLKKVLRIPYLYFVDKFGKKDVENTSPACHSSTYPELLDILKKDFDDMVLFLFVNGCISCLSSLKMNKLD